jgi:hypothetical protein
MEIPPPPVVVAFAFQTRPPVARPILFTRYSRNPDPLERIGQRSSKSSAERAK